MSDKIRLSNNKNEKKGVLRLMFLNIKKLPLDKVKTFIIQLLGSNKTANLP
jgi:hypothetical protein